VLQRDRLSHTAASMMTQVSPRSTKKLNFVENDVVIESLTDVRNSM